MTQKMYNVKHNIRPQDTKSQDPYAKPDPYAKDPYASTPNTGIPIHPGGSNVQTMQGSSGPASSPYNQQPVSSTSQFPLQSNRFVVEYLSTALSSAELDELGDLTHTIHEIRLDDGFATINLDIQLLKQAMLIKKLVANNRSFELAIHTFNDMSMPIGTLVFRQCQIESFDMTLFSKILMQNPINLIVKIMFDDFDII